MLSLIIQHYNACDKFCVFTTLHYTFFFGRSFLACGLVWKYHYWNIKFFAGVIYSLYSYTYWVHPLVCKLINLLTTTNKMYYLVVY